MITPNGNVDFSKTLMRISDTYGLSNKLLKIKKCNQKVTLFTHCGGRI